MSSRDQYEIIGLREISHFIKQPCGNVCLEKGNPFESSRSVIVILVKCDSIKQDYFTSANFCETLVFALKENFIN